MPAVLQRDEIEVEALVTDHYVEALLAAHARQADDAPSTTDLDPDVRVIARRLAADLVRFHPSFRFVEALSQRLAAAADHPGIAAAADGPGRAVAGWPGRGAPDASPVSIDAYRARGSLPAHDGSATDLAAAGRVLPADRVAASRPLLIGGAVASAALSIAGAAVIAWRLRVVDPAAIERVARAAGRISTAALPPARGRVH